MTLKAIAVFYNHPKITKATFRFPEFVPTCKKSVYSINWDTILEFYDQSGHTHFLTAKTSIFLNQLLASISACNKSSCFIIMFQRYKQFLKFCNLIDQEHFGSNIRNHISQIWDLWRNKVENINFHYTQNPEKINDQIFL